MSELHDRIVRLLPLVQNPSQYVGGEWNMCRKELRPGLLRAVLAFPDTYAIGMSHLGLQIICHVLNSRDDVYCERAFLPWPDMEALLRRDAIPLCSLETTTPLSTFDVVGFSLQYEMTYANVLEMLDLGGVPLHSSERTMEHPLVIAGGPGALNPEPLADFIDLFIVGDGEEAVNTLMDALPEAKKAPGRTDMLRRLAAANPSFYVPSLYDVEYGADGTIARTTPKDAGVPFPVRIAVVEDLNTAPFPTAPVVPNTEVVHDRIALEIMRGCPHSCRFCQSAPTRRPVRLRSVDTLLRLAKESYANTGCDEISLMSLSSNDYPHMDRLLAKLEAHFRPLGVSLSVPSLRVSENLMRLPDILSTVRKSGLTYAPEAASPDLAGIIGKVICTEDLINGVMEAYRAGWDVVKLYFMVGLPSERMEDVDGIIALARKVSNIRRDLGKPPGKVNVTIASFIPKPHTPLQWHPMAGREYLASAREKLMRGLRGSRIQVKFHDVDRSILEAVLSRADRRVGRVIEEAWRAGAKLDAWDERFRCETWTQAFAKCGIDPAFYIYRPRGEEEVFPWSHIDAGAPPERMLSEKHAAEELIARRCPAEGSGKSC